ncbi:MAG: hypothetical protein ACRETW_01115 [Stenotrophobium sp.]
MKRAAVTVFAILAILMQGLTPVWAAAARVQGAAQMQAADGGVMQNMPCYDSGKSAHGACCHDLHCACANPCGVSGAAVPAQSPELADYIAAHFEALQNTPFAFPAHTLNLLRPPIAPAS